MILKSNLPRLNDDDMFNIVKSRVQYFASESIDDENIKNLCHKANGDTNTAVCMCIACSNNKRS